VTTDDIFEQIRTVCIKTDSRMHYRFNPSELFLWQENVYMYRIFRLQITENVGI
jgi:hypothetical protein